MRLFEIGRRYLADGEQPTLGLLLAGDKRAARLAAGKAAGFDAFDAKAEALALLDAAGAPVGESACSWTPGATWHPGRSATLGLGPKTMLAAFGELHPRIAKALDAPAGTVAAEIYLDAIPAPRSVERRARRLRAAGAAGGDAATSPSWCPADLAADALVRAVRGADKAAITGGAAVRPLRRACRG